MDRSLDEIINERPRGGPRSRPLNGRGGGPRRGPARDYESAPRDGVKKYSQRDGSSRIDSEWMHDKYREDDNRRPTRGPRGPDIDRYSPGPPRDYGAPSARLKIDNLHFDIGETELKDLFGRLGPVQGVRMLFDRHDRSIGTAFVTYEYPEDAEAAVREYNDANAYGQPIRVQMAPSAPSRPARNPFDHVEKPSRSLFDRIESSGDDPRRGGQGGRRRARSASPGRLAPEGVDRYVPGGRSRDSRSPLPRRGGAPRETGRRPGARREDSSRQEGGRRGGRGKDGEGRQKVGGRPRKTAEELDAEMNDYWGGGGSSAGAAETAAAPAAAQNGQARGPEVATIANSENPGTGTTSTINADDDIDLMVE